MARYNKRTVGAIVEALKNLATVTEACEAAGIARGIYYQWLKEKPDFYELIEKTKDEIAEDMKAKAIKSIKDNFGKNWTSAAWWLERVYPDEYAKKEKIDQNMIIDAVSIKYITPEEPKQIDNKQQIRIEEPKNEDDEK